MLETMLTLIFVVPMVACCMLFVVCASCMQMEEDQRSGRKRGAAHSA